jgi:hypothetical protein
MTTTEAEELLSNLGGRICVRYFRRADGRIMTRDCPIGVKRVRGQRIWAASGFLAFLFNLAGGVGFFRPLQGEVGGSYITGSIKAKQPVGAKFIGKPAFTSENFDYGRSTREPLDTKPIKR